MTHPTLQWRNFLHTLNRPPPASAVRRQLQQSFLEPCSVRRMQKEFQKHTRHFLPPLWIRMGSVWHVFGSVPRQPIGTPYCTVGPQIRAPRDPRCHTLFVVEITRDRIDGAVPHFVDLRLNRPLY